jgi:putative mRNA 3-end processing factor
VPVSFHRRVLSVDGLGLVLDARRQHPLAFVSHAHSDHLARHQHVIATPATLELMQLRLGALREVTALHYQQPLHLKSSRLSLHSAGHMLGAAQLLVERSDGHRLVYSGDISFGPRLTSPHGVVIPCDTLVLEATFGHERFQFPPRAQSFDALAQWATRCLSNQIQPLVLAYSVGKSQETIAQLQARGLSACVHPAIAAASEVYVRHGVSISARTFDGTFRSGEVGIFPPRQRPTVGAQVFSAAALTGWTQAGFGAAAFRADVAFAISDHADFAELVQYASSSGAREVLTIHGHAEDLAASLRARGIFARRVDRPVQMALPLG